MKHLLFYVTTYLSLVLAQIIKSENKFLLLLKYVRVFTLVTIVKNKILYHVIKLIIYFKNDIPE
jgi:hypothetical protein